MEYLFDFPFFGSFFIFSLLNHNDLAFQVSALQDAELLRCDITFDPGVFLNMQIFFNSQISVNLAVSQTFRCADVAANTALPIT